MVTKGRMNVNNCITIIKGYFNNYLTNFTLSKEGSYTGYWWVQYINKKDNLIVHFDGDIGGHFYVKIFIDNTEYNLWQFNKEVNGASLSTEENIIFQLNILRNFLNEN